MFVAGDVETAAVIRPPGKDRFGDPLSGTPTETDIQGLFAPGPSTESGLGANQVTIDGTFYADGPVDVLPTDQLRVRGVLYQVVGQPQLWGSAGTTINLKRVTG